MRLISGTWKYHLILLFFLSLVVYIIEEPKGDEFDANFGLDLDPCIINRNTNNELSVMNDSINELPKEKNSADNDTVSNIL